MGEGCRAVTWLAGRLPRAPPAQRPRGAPVLVAATALVCNARKGAVLMVPPGVRRQPSTFSQAARGPAGGPALRTCGRAPCLPPLSLLPGLVRLWRLLVPQRVPAHPAGDGKRKKGIRQLGSPCRVARRAAAGCLRQLLCFCWRADPRRARAVSARMSHLLPPAAAVAAAPPPALPPSTPRALMRSVTLSLTAERSASRRASTADRVPAGGGGGGGGARVLAGGWGAVQRPASLR